jgi:hypothetical protein
MNSLDRSKSRSIRQSCTFCRKKKIWCSGELICSACQSRQLNCIYTTRAPKGRNTKPPENHARNQNKNVLSLDSSVELQSGARSLEWKGDITTNASTGLLLDSVNVNNDAVTRTTLGDLLESRFQKHYRHCGLSSLEAGRELGFPPSSPTEAISYKDLFFNITPALLDLGSAKIGRLRTDDGSDSFIPHCYHFRNCLPQDGSETMFQAGFPANNIALPSRSNQTACQLLEVWFSQHPLSLILSKTAFLHDFHGGLCDPGLLAIILADVTPSLQSSEWGQPESLRQFACEQVWKRPAEQTSLSMVQLLVLLGWHQICTGEVRRGACYINVAHELIGRWNQAQQRRLGTQRMNGVDYASVALELGYRIFWLTFAIELWIALQLDCRLEYPTRINPSLNLPSPEIKNSSVYELDRSSGNVASLAAQEQFWRVFWPLSHICCTVGPIYALLPRVASNPQASLTEPRTYWSAAILRRLHRLVNKHRSVSGLCQTVRGIVSEELERLQAEMGTHPSETVARIAYQLLSIHILFPKVQSAEPGSTRESLDTLVQNTTHAILAFIDLLRLVEQSLEPPDSLNGISPCSSAGLILAGLDASSRALRETLRLLDSDPDAKPVILHWQPNLVELAHQLHTVCKHPSIRVHPPARDVKQQLKQVKQRLEHLSDCLPLDVDIPLDDALFLADAEFEPLYLDTMALLDLEPDFDFFSSGTITPQVMLGDPLSTTLE